MSYRSMLALLLLGSFSAAAEETFLQFSELQGNGRAWQYYAPNQPCFNWPAEEQGKWCRNDGWRLFWYYNNYQTDHMGYMRFGHLLSDSKYLESGMLIASTGGAFRDQNGVVQYAGSPIKDSDALKIALQSPTEDSFAQSPVPGSIALYYKHLDPLRKIPEFSAKKTNRFSMMVWLPADPSSQERFSKAEKISSRPEHQMALYPFINSGKSGHYYHHTTNRGYGHWVKLQFDAHPTHHNQPVQPPLGAYREGGFDYPGDGAEYFAAMTSFSLVFYNAKGKPDPYMMVTDHWMSDWSPFENEETLNNLSVGFDPTKKEFDISLEDKYRCQDCRAEYEIRYSEKPINNDNWENATPVSKVENYFVEDDNVQQKLKKPSPYYTQVWGKFSLQEKDASRLSTELRRVYIAVKDVSSRNFSYDADDDVLVQSSVSGKKMPKRDLIKTLRYDFLQQPALPRVSTKNLTLFENDARVIPVSVGDSSQYGVFPPEVASQTSLSFQNGSLYVNSDKPTAAYGALYSLRPDGWLGSYTHIHTDVAQRDCLTGVSCKYERLGDFNASGSFWSGESGWRQIKFDKYSGFREGGVGIVLGAMGDYNYAAFSGPSMSLNQADIFEIAITNTLATDISTSIYFSTQVVGRRTYADAAKWQELPVKKIPAKSTVNFYIKAADLGSSIQLLNVNIPYNGIGLSLSSVSRYSPRLP